MKLKKRFKPTTIPILIVLLIIIISFLLISNFNNKIRPKMIDILEKRINKLSNDIIMDSFNNKVLNNHDINKIIKINKNKNDEIVAVDFDLKKAYEVSLDVTNNIKSSIDNIEKEYIDEQDVLKKINNNEYVLLIPIGIASNNLYLANLGPKIPVKVSYIGNLVTGLSTDVKKYGINNVLIEVYINITLNEEILVPYINKKINNNCRILISSQIIEGSVPDFYGGNFSTDSSLISIPLDK